MFILFFNFQNYSFVSGAYIFYIIFTSQENIKKNTETTKITIVALFHTYLFKKRLFRFIEEGESLRFAE